VRVGGLTARGRALSLSAGRQGHSTPRRQHIAVTKAQEIYDRVEAMVAAGTEKADAFKQIADETSRPYDSV
jgi:hypothetical protein